MCDSTKKFFCMFARHMCSGKPVVADCGRANSAGDCVPLPIGSVALRYSSPARPTRRISSSDRNFSQQLACMRGLPHVALQ